MKSISINDKVLFYAIIFFLAVFNAAALSDIPIWIKVVISTPFLLIFPGSLMLTALKMNVTDFWGTLVLRIGFSIAFLMFCGLFANWIFPQLGVSEPLSPIPMLCMINIFSMVLINILSFQRLIVPVTLSIPPITVRAGCFFLIPLIFPFLAVLGAISINNNGTNIPTILMLGGIAGFVLAIIFFRDTISPHVYPYALYCISLALLLTTSLRGWYITGHDIQLEYHVFQLTKQQYLWDINLYRDAYNACLSITILPTIFSDFLHIPDAYIYKVIFQIIFAFSPIIVFLFLRKYTSRILAFLSAFYFLSFPTFFNDMPMLNRQEISFIFFFLFLYISFHDAIGSKQKKIAGIVFAWGIVVSHYSTTYIVLAILLPIYMFRVFITNRRVEATARTFLPAKLSAHLDLFSRTHYISGTVLAVILVCTFFWNSQLTKTSNGLVETITQTFASMNTAFRGDNKSSDISYSLFFRRVIDDTQFIDEYIKNSLTSVKEQGLDDFYPQETYADYNPEMAPNSTLPLTPLGNILKQFHLDVFQFNYLLRQSLAKVIQLLIVVGCIGLFFNKTDKKYDTEYILACFVSIVYIFLMIVLPHLSVNYGLLRLFQQFLVFLGLPVVIGNLLLLRFLHKNTALYLAGSLAVVFFLTISGFFSEMTGGYYPQLNLNSAGIYYDAYYLHKAEIFSRQWLARSMSRRFTLHADTLASNKLYEMGDVHVVHSIFPQAIQQSGYVYAGVTNTKGRTILSVDRSLYVPFPLEFLDSNKNVLYDNGSSRIYK